MDTYHNLDISGFYYPILRSAVSTTYFNFLDPETDFGSRVYSLDCVKMNEVEDFLKRVKTK